MPSANKHLSSAVVDRIEKARHLLDEALAFARNANATAPRREKPTQQRGKPNVGTVDFSMPLRPFVKKYCNGMNGPKKFTLLVAYLTKGDPQRRVTLAEVVKNWDKMTAKGLLGMKFNHQYSATAKENDWTHAEEFGSYKLRPSWKSIFE